MEVGTLRCIECNQELRKLPGNAPVPLYHCKNQKCLRWGLITVAMRYADADESTQGGST